MRYELFATLVVTVLLMSGCENTPFDHTNPGVEPTEIRFVEARDLARARVYVTLENTGEEKAYVVSCDFALERGNQIEVDVTFSNRHGVHDFHEYVR